MLLSDRIQSLALGNASHFRLKLHSLTGNLRVFPPEEGSFYRVGDSPYGIPGGRYTISFYDSEQRPSFTRSRRCSSTTRMRRSGTDRRISR